MALGPARYSVFLQQRGGAEVARLPWSSLSWGRLLDDCSSASVTVPVTSRHDKLAWALADLEAFEFELSIWRYITAARFEEVWVGPISEPEWSDEGVRIPARDLSEWFERRVLPVDRSFASVDLATIFSTLAVDAMAADSSPGVTVAPAPTGVLGSRTVVAAARTIAADALRELARDGLDYTVVGRQVLIGGVQVPASRLPVVTNRELEKAKASGLGLSSASKVHVVGASGHVANLPISASVGGVSARIGLVERVFSESAIQDASSAARAAKTRWDWLRRMPVALSGNYNHRRGPQVDQLVPGALARAQLWAGCKHVDSDVRLSRVNVTASANDQGVNETVSVEFVPVGSTE